MCREIKNLQNFDPIQGTVKNYSKVINHQAVSIFWTDCENAVIFCMQMVTCGFV